MKGQATEYILVFAAVVAVAVIVLAYALMEFPYAAFDSQAVILGVSAGYSYEVNSFRDGAIATYFTDYNAESKEVDLTLSVVGWNASVVRKAIEDAMSHYGYKVK